MTSWIKVVINYLEEIGVENNIYYIRNVYET